jgi:hypothetical protein
MFSIDFEDFLNYPFSFDSNTTNQIFLFLHVFYFQGPSYVKHTQYFCHIIFLKIEELKKKSMGNVTRRKRGPTDAGR